MPRPRSTDPKRLKGAQADKLRSLASDGRRSPTDRQWALRMLHDAGEDPTKLEGPGKPSC